MLKALKSLIRKQRVGSSADHLALGQRGERVAVKFIERERYRVVATNFVVPLGRGLRGQKLNAEIDVIAYDGDTLAFVEVKTRSSDDLVAPERAVDLRKQRQIARAARRYRQLMKITNEPYRYDVVTLVQDKDGYKIELLRGYFDDGVFRRARFFTGEY